MKRLENKTQISWIILLPINGKSTKRDVNVLNKNKKDKLINNYSIIGYNNYMIAKFFMTKEKAQIELKKLEGLHKPYRAFIINDEQFGKIEIDYVKGINKIPFTKKQLETKIIIK